MKRVGFRRVLRIEQLAVLSSYGAIFGLAAPIVNFLKIGSWAEFMIWGSFVTYGLFSMASVAWQKSSFKALLTINVVAIVGLDSFHLLGAPRSMLFWLESATLLSLAIFTGLLLWYWRPALAPAAGLTDPIRPLSLPKFVSAAWVVLLAMAAALPSCGRQTDYVNTRNGKEVGGSEEFMTGKLTDGTPEGFLPALNFPGTSETGCAGSPNGQPMSVAGVNLYTGCLIAPIAHMGGVTLVYQDGLSSGWSAPTNAGKKVRMTLDDMFSESGQQLLLDTAYGPVTYVKKGTDSRGDYYWRLPNDGSRAYLLTSMTVDSCGGAAISGRKIEWLLNDGTIRAVYEPLNDGIHWLLRRSCNFGGEPFRMSQKVELVRDPNNNSLKKISYENGDTYHFNYNTTNEHLVSIVGPLDSLYHKDRLELTVDSGGYLVGLKRSNYPTRQFNYDSNHHLTSISEASGAEIKFRRGPASRDSIPGRVMSVEMWEAEDALTDPFLVSRCFDDDSVPPLECLLQQRRQPKDNTGPTQYFAGGLKMAYCTQEDQSLRVRVSVPKSISKDAAELTFADSGRHPLLHSVDLYGNESRSEYAGPEGLITKAVFPDGGQMVYGYDTTTQQINSIRTGPIGREILRVNAFAGYDSPQDYISENGYHYVITYDAYGRIGRVMSTAEGGGSPQYQADLLITRGADVKGGSLLSLGISGSDEGKGGNMTARFTTQTTWLNAHGIPRAYWEPGYSPNVFQTQFDAKQQDLPSLVAFNYGDKTEYLYDDMRRLQRVTYKDTTNAEIDSLQYSYNERDQIISMETNQEIWRYCYDEDGGLISATHDYKAGADILVKQSTTTYLRGARKVWERKGPNISRASPAKGFARRTEKFPPQLIDVADVICD